MVDPGASYPHPCVLPEGHDGPCDPCDPRPPETRSAAQEREFCPTCGSALAYDKSGHILYGGRLSFRDFEQIVLSLGASGSDVRRLWPKEVPMRGYWHKPRLYRVAEGGDLLLGPVQFNWFNDGFRVHFTWPFRTPRTVTLWQK